MPLGAITEEHFDRIFATNVRGVLFTVQKAQPLLTNGASVILTTFTTSIQDMANLSVYSASKAAVRNFALLVTGRVNAVSPSPIRTPGLGDLLPKEARQGLFDHLASQFPLGRLGEPGEIGKVVAFLTSDAASFVMASSCSSTVAWPGSEAQALQPIARAVAAAPPWSGCRRTHEARPLFVQQHRPAHHLDGLARPRELTRDATARTA